MKTFIFGILLLQACLAHAGENCFDGRSQLDTTACVGAQAGQARLKLQRYLAAAGVRLRQQPGAAEAFADAQAKWEAFVEADCASIRTWYDPGSIKDEAYLSCKLRHFRRRTADVWKAFLTFADTTPPVLPDPAE
jgi:uncharacterized protein YecT (DUF1311 family)